MPDNRIKAYIAAGEGARAQKLALEIAGDPRFEPLEVNTEIPADVQFSITGKNEYPMEKDFNGYLMRESELEEKIFNVELKECSDYVQSALGKEGHLYEQVLSIQEAGHPGMIVVLGGDNQVTEAIIDALKTRYKGKELGFNISSYESRLIDFEAKCKALRCPVMRWQTLPWKRLLSTVDKELNGCGLMDYRPRPADNDRVVAAASMLYKGIGPSVMSTVLQDYDLCFVPKVDPARQPCDMPGIGPVRAAAIDKRVCMIYGMRGKV